MHPGRVPAWLSAMLFGGLAVSILFTTAQSARPPNTGWGLPQLMHELARVRSASARFTERKTMHILKAPLVTSGTLRYVAPDYLQKVTLSPQPESFVLNDSQVTITGGWDGRTHTFSLTEDPQITGLVEGIRATLAGDLQTLERFYVVELSGDNMRWQLVLRPKSRELAHFVSWMRIQGHDDRIDVVDTQSGNGDHSEMTVVGDVTDVR